MNRSLENVVVNGVEYEPGKVVYIMNTDTKGEDKTTNETLPYGTYEIIELRVDNTVATGDVFDELTEEKLGKSIYANNHGNLDYPKITGNLAEIIAAHTYVERSQQHGKDYRYMNNAGPICSEAEWSAKTDEEKKAILLTSPDLTEMETYYFIGMDYSTVEKFGSMLYKDNRETFEIRNHHEVAGEEESDVLAPNNGKERIHFDNRVVRGGFELYK